MALALHVLLPLVTLGVGVHWGALGAESCEQTRYVELGQTEVLKCNFRTFFSIIWYGSTNYVEDEPIIYDTESIKGGPGYISGDYDIAGNGSLIIRNVTSWHDRNFTVIKLDSSRDSLIPHYVRAILIVKPLPGHPVINRCSSDSQFCLAEVTEEYNVSCSVNGARPPVDLNWFKRTNHGDVMDMNEKTIIKSGLSYTTIVIKSNALNDKLILDLLVCKSYSPTPLLSKAESVVLIQNTGLDLLSVEPLKILVRFGSKMTLSCSDSEIMFFSWKRITGRDKNFENVLYGICESTTYLNTVLEDYSVDNTGSLIVHDANTQHEGVYCCISGNGDLGMVRSHEVTIYVPAVPENPVVEECGRNDEYCVLTVEGEGTLTCVLNGIRPQVHLEWSVVSKGFPGIIEFMDEKHTVHTYGNTYRISLTSKFVIQSAWQDRLTIECRSSHTMWKTLYLSTKVDLLIANELPASRFQRPWMFSLSALAIVPVVVLCMIIISRTACGRTNKQQTLVQTNDEENSTTVPLMDVDSGEKKQSFIKELRVKYKELHRSVQSNPWIRSNALPDESIFVDPEITWYQNNGIYVVLDSYHFLVKELCQNTSQVVLEGRPGYGKTTITTHMAYEWSNTSTGNQSLLRNFEIVVLLKMTQLQGQDSLYKAIKSWILPKQSSLTQDDIESIMTESQSVLVMIDDVEFHDLEDTCELVSTLPRLYKVLFTTSRLPCIVEENVAHKKSFKLSGFNEKKQMEYLEKMADSNTLVAPTHILSRLRKYRVINDACEVPMFFVMFAHMTNDCSNEIESDSVTSFFQCVLSSVWDNNVSKSNTFNKQSSLENITKEHQQFEKAAFDLWRLRKNASWNKEDLYTLVGDRLYNFYIQSGILVEESGNLENDCASYAKKVRFRHDILCQWYAAHYVAERVKDADMETVKKFLHKAKTSNAQYLFQFSCGLNGSSAAKIIRYLNDEDNSGNLTHLCLVEQIEKFQNFNWTKWTVKNICSQEITFERFDSRLLHTSTKEILEKASNAKIRIKGVEFIECVNYSSITDVTIGLTSGVVLPKLDTLETFSMIERQSQLTEEDIKNVFVYALSCTGLTSIRFSCSFLPCDFKVENLLSLLERRGIKATWNLTTGLPQFLRLNMKNGKWEDIVTNVGSSNKTLENSREGITLLEECELNELSDDEFAETQCRQHEDNLLTHFCATCDCKICQQCLLASHKKKLGCDVIELSHLTLEVESRLKELHHELDSLKILNEKAENVFAAKTEVLEVYNNIFSDVISEDQKYLLGRVESFAKQLLHNLSEKDDLLVQHFKSEKEEIENIKYAANKLKEQIENFEKGEFHKLVELKKATGRGKSMRLHLQQQRRLKFKDNFQNVSFKEILNDGAFGLLKTSSLIGGVIIRENQIVHVFDERQTKGGIRFVCLNPKDITTEYWEYVEANHDKKFPVVMSSISLNHNTTLYILVAAGDKVLLVRPHKGKLLYDSIQSVSPLTIGDIKPDSWISSIYAYYKTGESHDEFLISVTHSSLLLEYRVSGEIVRKIETKYWAYSNRCIAYTDLRIIAVASRDSDDIILITGDDTVEKGIFLRPPATSTILLPMSIIWTGALWLVLYVSDAKQKNWKIASYKESGDFIEVCDEGTTCADTEVPVSICRFQYTGFASFANNSVRAFKCPKTTS